MKYLSSDMISMAFEKEAKKFIFSNYRSSLLVNSIKFNTPSLGLHYNLVTILGVGNSGMNQMGPHIILVKVYRGFIWNTSVTGIIRIVGSIVWLIITQLRYFKVQVTTS